MHAVVLRTCAGLAAKKWKKCTALQHQCSSLSLLSQVETGVFVTADRADSDCCLIFVNFTMVLTSVYHSNVLIFPLNDRQKK